MRQVRNLLPLNPVGSVPIPSRPSSTKAPILEEAWSFSYSREINKTLTHACVNTCRNSPSRSTRSKEDGIGTMKKEGTRFNHDCKISSSSFFHRVPFTSCFTSDRDLSLDERDSFSDFNSIQHSMIIDNYEHLGEVAYARFVFQDLFWFISPSPPLLLNFVRS